jgi:hypothetical protein
MNTIRLTDSEIEPALVVLETAKDSFTFDGDMSDYKMGWVINIMIKQLEAMKK